MTEAGSADGSFSERPSTPVRGGLRQCGRRDLRPDHHGTRRDGSEFGSFDPYQVASCEMPTDPTDPTQVPLEAFDNCDDDLSISIEACR